MMSEGMLYIRKVIGIVFVINTLLLVTIGIPYILQVLGPIPPMTRTFFNVILGMIGAGMIMASIEIAGFYLEDEN